MHLIQAFKMACKSLWTKKMRSFLTMLGIIIGVMTVSLLTTVAQGVSDAVISSIRSQSTLSIMMNMSTEMTYSTANELIGGVQSEYDQDDDSYFDYSLVLSSSSALGLGDLEGEPSGAIDDSCFIFDRAYEISEEDYNKLSDDQKTIADNLKTIKARSAVYNSSIYAVDKNFDKVYDFKISGAFPTKNDEILVDESFVKAYFDFDDIKKAVGENVTLGIEIGTDVIITFGEVQDASILNKLSGAIATLKLKETASATLSTDGKSATFHLEFFRVFNENTMKSNLSTILSSMGENVDISRVAFLNTYDSTNAKTFVISGVLADENNGSLFSSSGASSKMNDTDELNALSLAFAATSNQKGTLYMLLDEETKVIAGVDADSSIDDKTIRFAYFRFKNEDVMESVNNKISLAFIQRQFTMMQDFMLISMSSVSKIISNVMNIMTTMLAVISGISLVVGGIGIMNIMLVAVTERTREIGIRKAIGAKRSSILAQFLVEALLLSLLGGAIGLGISAIGVLIIGNLMGISMSMPLWVILMSVGFCTAIGLIFGMYPAIKASKMQPIDALRRE